MKPTIQTVLLIFSICCCTTQKEVVNTSNAKFIFKANIEKVGSATIPEISDVSKCIVTKINEVFYAPSDFADWTGRSITVVVKDPEKKKVGSEMVFYTNGWLYGKSLAVIEIESIDAGQISKEQVLKEVQAGKDSRVRERLRKSELVVSGEILDVKETKKQSARSEHDPKWTNAVIRIDTLIMGQIAENDVIIQFASSKDVMWANSPKFTMGEKGIWLLRRSEDKVYTVIESMDFYPIEKLEYIQSLLK